MDIISNIINIVLTGAIGYLVWLLQKHGEGKGITKKALRVLLRESIEARYDKYKDKESLTREEFTDFNEMCDVYFALKGNGTGKRMYDEIQKKRVI